ncbi:MAG: DUF2017 family protein [Acidimicrobiales bacterium]
MTDAGWDPDHPLVVESDIDDPDGELHLVVPVDVAVMMTARLAQGAAAVSPELAVTVQDVDGERELDDHELRELVQRASDACLDALAAPALAGDDELMELAEAAGLLSSLWTLNLEVAYFPDPEARLAEAGWVDAIGRLAADCQQMLFTRFRPRRDGTFTLKWRNSDRELVAAAIVELRALLGTDDPSIARLFPAAYGGDEERNAGWDALARRELVERRLEALETVESLLSRDRCTADELNAVMRSINDVRLVLGTRLDVDESGVPASLDEADRGTYAVYEHLGFLLSLAVRALRSTL